jgi:hypothetical protein
MHDTLQDIVSTGTSVFSPPAVEGCSQIFAPCLDPQCARPCGARRAIPEINLDEAETRVERIQWISIYLLASFLAVLLAIACVPQGIENWKATQIAEMEP